MIKSNLATNIVESGNYTSGRLGYKICKFTPHHMAGILSAEECAKIFQNPSRQASANYCIGNEGEIVCCVGEENRAWTSSSKLNDCQAITVEVSNSEIGGDWKISEKAWNSLVMLAVDVCRRNNFRLVYDGTPNGSLTMHKMFANTLCPGPYLEGRLPELANTVNAILDGDDINKFLDNAIIKKISVNYQAYISNYWLPNVIDCNNTADGYAGIYGVPISGIRANIINEQENDYKLMYKVHTVNGNWLDEVINREKDRNGDDFAGILGTPIDAIMVKSTLGIAKYRVHTLNGAWLPWVNGYDVSDSINGYAGNLGSVIDGIQIQITN